MDRDNVEGRPMRTVIARLGKALAGNIVVQAQRELHSRGAEQVERKIVDRIPDGLFACPEHEQHRRMAQKHNTVSTTDMARNTQALPDALGFVHCRRAPRGCERCAAHARWREGRDDRDDGEGDAEPGQRQWANLQYPADENAVDNVVRRLTICAKCSGWRNVKEACRGVRCQIRWRGPREP